MTTETLSTYLPNGLLISDSYTELDITTTGGVGGFGIGTSDDISQTVKNAGRVYGNDFAIYVNRGGQIINQRTGFINGAFAGISGTGDVTNYGTLEGTQYAVRLDGNATVVNGSDADPHALISGHAIYLGGLFGTVTNLGTIAAAVRTGGTGLVTNGDLGDAAATIDDGGGVRLFSGGTVGNFGTIQAYGRPGYAGVYLGGAGTVTNGAATDRGALIAGYVGISIHGGAGTIANSGTIRGFGDSSSAEAVYLAAGGLITSGSVNDATTLIEGYSGLKLAAGGRAVNFGVIAGLGDAGGAGAYLAGGASLVNGATGHVGALIEGFRGVVASGAATVTNYGVIAEANGIAVAFSTASDLLVVEAGCAFEGAVEGGGGQLHLATGVGTITAFAGGTLTVSGSMAATTFQDFDTVRIGPAATFADKGAVSVAAGQTVDAAGTLSLGGAGKNHVVNAGLIEATDGGRLTLAGAVVNTGTLAAFNGSTLMVTGAVTGTGIVTISKATASFAAAFNEAVTFTGTTGELALGQSQSFTGTVTGFSRAGKTSFDLADIGFVSAGEATFAGTKTGGVLTVTDGTHTAHLALEGNFLSSTFVAGSDGAGGTTVRATSGAMSAPPHRLIAAMADLGGSAGEAIHLGQALMAREAALARPHAIA